MKDNETCPIRVPKIFRDYIDEIRGQYSRADMVHIIYLLFLKPNKLKVPQGKKL